jgi:hypothetical protein
MGNVLHLDQYLRSRAVQNLCAAREARERLDTDSQLGYAVEACELFERTQGDSDRSTAGLLEATSLEIDARGAFADHQGARGRASRTVELLGQRDVGALARDIAARHLRRTREVAGEADAVMREAMADYMRLRQAPLDPLQRDVESLAALTTVLSAAHRVGSSAAFAIASQALKRAPPLRDAVNVYDERAAARYDLWAGLYLSAEGEQRARAVTHLDRYLAWTSRVPTKRNVLLSRFAAAERLVSGGQRGRARDEFHHVLADTRTLLPRKHQVVTEILGRRGVI